VVRKIGLGLGSDLFPVNFYRANDRGKPVLFVSFENTLVSYSVCATSYWLVACCAGIFKAWTLHPVALIVAQVLSSRLVLRSSPKCVMFSLIFGFYNLLFSKPDIHVLVIGLDHAGKSTLLEHIKTVYSRVQGLPPDKITPTIGMNLGKFKHKGTQVVIWDLGGQLKMRAIWERYYDEAQSVVFVVDAADPARLHEAKAAYDAACASPALQDVPIMIFANKQDLPGAVSLHDIAEIFYTPNEDTLAGIHNLSIKKLAAQNQAAARASHRLFGISALTGRGVPEAMETLMTETKWHVQKAREELVDYSA